MTNLLSRVLLKDEDYASPTPEFKFEDTIGFKTYGESAKVKTYDELFEFMNGSGPFLQSFAQKYARQYQITSVMQLLHAVANLLEKAIREGNPQHVLVASNHLSTCSDLVDMLGAMLNNPEQMAAFQRHPSFVPEAAEFNQLSGFVFVMTMAIRLLNNELVVVFQAMKDQAANT